MRRRDFITLLGGTAAVCPLTVRAQQSERMRHIGVLMAFSENDPEAQSWAGGFREELGKLGWTEGRNIEIGIRWAAADVASMKRFAKELVALQPDLMVTSTTPAAAAMSASVTRPFALTPRKPPLAALLNQFSSSAKRCGFALALVFPPLKPRNLVCGRGADAPQASPCAPSASGTS